VTRIKRNPVLLAMSLLATLQALTGGAFLVDLFGAKVAAGIVLALAAIQLGVQYWVRGEVTPLSDPRDNFGQALRPRIMKYNDPL
jgi:hypothetical protein